MNDNQNWNTLGDQIKGAVSDALESGDFKNLNTIVSGSVTTALGEAKKKLQEVQDNQNIKQAKPGHIHYDQRTTHSSGTYIDRKSVV